MAPEPVGRESRFLPSLLASVACLLLHAEPGRPLERRPQQSAPDPAGTNLAPRRFTCSSGALVRNPVTVSALGFRLPIRSRWVPRCALVRRTHPMLTRPLLRFADLVRLHVDGGTTFDSSFDFVIDGDSLPRFVFFLVQGNRGQISGSNGHRPRVWKVELQRLADKLGMSIHVSHFPPAPASGTRSNTASSHSSR